MNEVIPTILKEIYKERSPDAKKYDFGMLLVVGGSDFYSGAPALSALAAFRAGVDMVQVIAPKRAADIIATFSPILAAYPLDAHRLRDKKHISTLIEMVRSAKTVTNGKAALVVGGGMGRSEETQKAICELISKVSVSTVIDADGIHAVAKNTKILEDKKCVLTPHSYEFYILTGKDVSGKTRGEKEKIVQEEAARLQATIILKGGVDIISNGSEVAVNKTGSPYMTVGGTGDTLAGICGALIARGADHFIAAQAAAFINGRAGEIAAAKAGESLVATDLIDAIPEAIRSVFV